MAEFHYYLLCHRAEFNHHFLCHRVAFSHHLLCHRVEFNFIPGGVVLVPQEAVDEMKGSVLAGDVAMDDLSGHSPAADKHCPRKNRK